LTEAEKDTILKNAQELNRESRLKDLAADEKMAIARRARVRALVHSMLVGNSYFIVPSSGVPAISQVVLFAQELDTLIESVGVAKDEQ
jgi:hypothetical protein